MRALSLVMLLMLTGCQGARLGGPPLDGRWASDDGVFVATFRDGAFSSRLVDTGDVVVADGRYSRRPGGLALAWTSIVTNEQRSAQCRFLAPNRLSCNPLPGDPFTMTRVA